MAEEIQEAVQIIRVAYDGIEIAMKGRKRRHCCHAEGNRFLKRDA